MQKGNYQFTDLIANVAPWLAPIPTAYLVGRAAVTWLSWPLPVAICAALVIESLGLAATNTALELWNYNRSKRKTDPGAPFTLAGALVLVYAGVAILLTVALEVIPELRAWSPAIFPGLSLAGVTILALRADHKRRLADIAQDKAEKRAERQARKLTGNLPTPGGNMRQLTGKLDWRALPKDDRAIIATMNTAAIQERYQVSERTARNWRTAARGNGYHKQEVTS